MILTIGLGVMIKHLLIGCLRIGSFIEHPLRNKEMGDWSLTMLEHFSYSGTHNINLRAGSGRHIDIIQYMQESRKQLPGPPYIQVHDLPFFMLEMASLH